MPDAKDPGFAPKTYRRDCLLGALGALLMLAGDLCLSVIPANPGGQRTVCQRGVFKRVVGAVAAAVAAGDGALRHGTRLFHRARFHHADSTAA